MGATKSWRHTLNDFTGETKMSAAALNEYFKPLLNFLKEENTKLHEEIGWPNYMWRPRYFD